MIVRLATGQNLELRLSWGLFLFLLGSALYYIDQFFPVSFLSLFCQFFLLFSKFCLVCLLLSGVFSFSLFLLFFSEFFLVFIFPALLVFSQCPPAPPSSLRLGHPGSRPAGRERLCDVRVIIIIIIIGSEALKSRKYIISLHKLDLVQIQ